MQKGLRNSSEYETVTNSNAKRQSRDVTTADTEFDAFAERSTLITTSNTTYSALNDVTVRARRWQKYETAL
jgi:hypothetical protein